MRKEFARALAAANDRFTAPQRIDAIKRAVTTEVHLADPTTSVRFTDYFNHSFAPDMVLRWPRENRSRFLYIRPASNVEWLLEDLPALTTYRPLVFTLDELSAGDTNAAGDGAALGQLAIAASERDTWVADPTAFESISAANRNTPVLGFLGQALIRGGRGLSDGKGVQSLAKLTVEGFDGAAQLQYGATRSAVNAIQSNLNGEQAGRMTRILRAVWEGHGGHAASFPTGVDTGQLTDDDLSYLLNSMLDAPPSFWRRIGRGITLEQLGRLKIDDPSANLQLLVQGNLNRFQAKAVRVLAEPFGLGEIQTVPRWAVRRNCLVLRGPEWVAYIAARRGDELPPADEVPPPNLERVKHRHTTSPPLVVQVELGGLSRAVTYESKDRVDVLDDPGLSRVADEIRGSRVEKLTIELDEGGRVELDFLTATGLSPTSSTVRAISLLRSTLPLLVEMSDDERDRLFAGLPDPQLPQEDLFTTLEDGPRDHG